MKKLLILTAMVLIAISVQAQTTWTVDNTHSTVKFAVSHLVITDVEGSFKVYSGTLQFPGTDLTNASVEFFVDVNSIDTGNEMRDNHLKTDDFFNAAQYPKMTFKSVSWKKIDEKNYELIGDLTIRNVTKRVPFKVTYNGMMKDPYGNTKAGFKATAVINRFDYGLKFNAVTEAGGAVVGKDVVITLNLQFVQQKSGRAD